MKTLISSIALVCLVLVSLGYKDAFSQWQPDVRLTNSAGVSELSDNNARCIASYSNFVHVVWSDFRDGNFEIYYKRSTDGGISWGADTRMTNDPAASRCPSIAVRDSIVHVVWHDERFNREIYYKRSTDNGLTWSADIRLTNNWAGSWYPSIAVSGQKIYVVWHDERDSSASNIYFKSSTDDGVTWGADIPLTQRATYSTYPTISVNSAYIHVAWKDERTSNAKIYYRRSTNSGANWEPEIKLSDDEYPAGVPSISASMYSLSAVWSEYINGHFKVIYKRSGNGGANWAASIIMANDTLDTFAPSVFAYGSNVHVTMLKAGSYPNIWYVRSGIEGTNWEMPVQITNINSQKMLPCVNASGTSVHVIWSDYRDTDMEIYYKQNPTANVGIENLSSETPSSYSLYQNFPNPFNPVTTIQYALPKESRVTLRIYDITGREVRVLVNEIKTAGYYAIQFNGSELSSGIYFYKIEAGDFIQTKRMVLIK
ncbi:MAG: T9SS type A sorting domain-containing protein [Bacteroidetes bacterium]|nr:T9SS type A sorting domain-containing protein [Bacteroidota bacterium]